MPRLLLWGVNLIAGNCLVMRSFTETHCDSFQSFSSVLISHFASIDLLTVFSDKGRVSLLFFELDGTIVLPHNGGIMQLN